MVNKGTVKIFEFNYYANQQKCEEFRFTFLLSEKRLYIGERNTKSF